MEPPPHHTAPPHHLTTPVNPNMSSPALPPDILYPLLREHILSPSTTIHAALQLRLLSKTLNLEILHQMFTVGLLDSKVYAASWDRRAVLDYSCRVCKGVVRPERRGKAMNRVTVRRCLDGWLRRGRWPDSRTKAWRKMDDAVKWVSGEGRRLVDDAEAEAEAEVAEGDGQSVSEPVPVSVAEAGKEEALSNLVDGTITLFGVRDTWAYLGPHYGSCRPSGAQFPEHHKDPRPVEFWCLITAAYAGDTGMVRYLLGGSRESSPGITWVMARTGQRSPSSMSTPTEPKDVMLDDWSIKSPEVLDWTPSTNSVAAALTIAIRRGHRDMVNMLLGMGLARIVCCDVRFWNGRTVMGTLFAAAADRDPKVAQLAVDTIRRILGEWRAKGLWVKDRHWCIEHLRYALDIPTSSGILRDVLWSLFPGPCDAFCWDEEISNRLLYHLLCQAALTNDVERAREAVKFMGMDTGKVVKKPHSWSKGDMFVLNPCNGTDEYGVRSDRLFDAMNPIRIAAVLSHYEILEWLLGEGWEVREKVKPWRLKATGWKKVLTLDVLARKASKNGTLLDTRQEAVYDAFISRERLPAYIQPASDPKILEMILRKSEGLCWGRETIITAGTRNADIFEQFVNFVDLGKQVPHKVDEVKGNLFVAGAYARTIGERSLQHALKAGRFDDAKLLLMKGVKLAEAIRSDGFYHDDPEAMAILRGLQEMKLPGVSVVSRTMQVLYWVNGDVQLRLGQTKTIEENEKGYVWKDGQKVKRIGTPTFPKLKSS